jgi:hypothetical protein
MRFSYRYFYGYESSLYWYVYPPQKGISGPQYSAPDSDLTTQLRIRPDPEPYKPSNMCQHQRTHRPRVPRALTPPPPLIKQILKVEPGLTRSLCALRCGQCAWRTFEVYKVQISQLSPDFLVGELAPMLVKTSPITIT